MMIILINDDNNRIIMMMIMLINEDNNRIIIILEAWYFLKSQYLKGFESLPQN